MKEEKHRETESAPEWTPRRSPSLQTPRWDMTPSSASDPLVLCSCSQGTLRGCTSHSEPEDLVPGLDSRPVAPQAPPRSLGLVLTAIEKKKARGFEGVT